MVHDQSRLSVLVLLGLTTVGERAAARAAAKRLEARIARATRLGLGGDCTLDAALEPCAEAEVPTTADLLRVVRRWMDGTRTGADMAHAARSLVDRVVLPDRPADDPLSIRVEVVMVLTTLPDGPVGLADAPALCRFLQTPADQARQGWEDWFRHLRGDVGRRLETGQAS